VPDQGIERNKPAKLAIAQDQYARHRRRLEPRWGCAQLDTEQTGQSDDGKRSQPNFDDQEPSGHLRQRLDLEHCPGNATPGSPNGGHERD
jgi:hypothetical protein